MLQPTFADLLRPSRKAQQTAYDTLLIVGGALFVALLSQIRIQIGISPVPVTAQTLAVLLVGATLGSRRGSLAMLAYLAEGAMGLPVFAGGIATVGYRIGFVVAAFVVGWLAEHGWDRHPITTASAMLIGNTAIYLIGIPWLAALIGGDKALAMGLYPFIVGDTLKLVLAMILLPAGWRLAKSTHEER
ncbi:MAG: biotin transporter BioY [Anaerolineae bacterium]|nr:biotin transporter BioY [Anaerolineae bacterium]